jgi:hypothetical protein
MSTIYKCYTSFTNIKLKRTFFPCHPILANFGFEFLRRGLHFLQELNRFKSIAITLKNGLKKNCTYQLIDELVES